MHCSSQILFFLGVYQLLISRALASTIYVAPNLTESVPLENQQYLIGVISTFFVAVAAYLGIKSLMDINYDDDTLLMVEVPHDHLQDVAE